MDCRFDGCPFAAVARVFVPQGCVCYPDDRQQYLCAQHLNQAEPLGELRVVEELRVAA